jgi:hypothetical protein
MGSDDARATLERVKNVIFHVIRHPTPNEEKYRSMVHLLAVIHVPVSLSLKWRLAVTTHNVCNALLDSFRRKSSRMDRFKMN